MGNNIFEKIEEGFEKVLAALKAKFGPEVHDDLDKIVQTGKADLSKDVSEVLGQAKEVATTAAEAVSHLTGEAAAPTTETPASLRTARLSRKSQACFVQPGVIAAG